uniref:Endonuclease/exonuclease/phosphatase domain-containing protein n=1 Tax=Plectus sambesii TaxID=2011161 RepID=A0A914XMU6_9BILA
MTKSVMCFQPLSSRLAILTLAGTITTHIIAVYAPTEVSADDAKDNFYTKLQDTVDTIPKKDLILLAGDFNAHVGASRAGWETTLGNFGRGDTNNNGLRLLSFATANGLLCRPFRQSELNWGCLILS